MNIERLMQDDEPSMAEGLIKREVFDYDKYDFSLLHMIENMREMKRDWKFQVETVVATWILFNAVTTIMIILTSTKKSVSYGDRREFGESQFVLLFSIVTYAPLGFFTLLVLLFNNYYSERAFYARIQSGAIVDYPASSAFGYMLSHWQPLVFFVFFIAYAVLTFWTMIRFNASFGTMGIFANNLLIGVGLFWYRQQSIEWKFVSVSDFIQAFPDRENSYGNMDEKSLHSASRLMEKFVLLESDQPSYGSYMREKWWEEKNFTGFSQILHHVTLWGLIFILAGMSFSYFFILGRFDLKSRWNEEISPCVTTCAWMAINRTNENRVAPVSQIPGSLCAACACECMFQLQMVDQGTIDGCTEHFSSKYCDVSTESACPNTCSFQNV